MSLRIRSSSMGATPRPKKHFTTRAESAVATALDVRCACQFFQSDSLLPERINPIGSRPSSSQGYYSRPISPDLTHHVFEPDYVDPDSQRNFSFGVVGATDYYSESLSSIPNIPALSDVADANKTTMNGQQNLHLSATNGLNQDIQTESSNLRRDPSQSDYQNTLRQKDPSQSVLLRRRSESAQKNLEGIGRQRDPSTSSILRRRFSEKSVNGIQQRDPTKSSMLRRRMDSQGSLQAQSSIEEPLAKERKLIESTPVPPQPPTNAERFMLSKNTLQAKPSIELSDLYRDTMKFTELEREEQPKPKTFDVGILDLMTLGTSFIQKGVIKGNKKEKKSRKDPENVDETLTTTEDEVDEPHELLDNTNTTEDQPAFSSPTSSALVHIGQNIYIEEPGEESVIPVKNERRSRRDYPDKVNKKTDDRQEESSGMIREFKKTKSTDEDHETDENISSTLLPRDLREQSTCTVNSQKMEPDKSTTLQGSTPSECIKQIDVSTSSLLRNRYSQNYSMDTPQPTDGHTVNPSPSVLIKQRDPSTSSLLRKRYGQSLDDKVVAGYMTSMQNADEETSNAIELAEKKAAGFENGTNAIGSHEEIAKNHLPSTPEFRGKLDWIERTYNTR